MMRLEEKKKENLEYDGPPLYSQPHPWLVICSSRKTQTFFSISEDRSYKRSIPELGNALIRAYAQEWLVLEDFDSNDCYLWNPISNDKIQLPPLPYDDKLLCLLSAPPNDPECRVLFLIHEATPLDTDDDDNSNDDIEDENSNDDTNDDTDTNDDDTDNENSDDDDTNDDYPDDDDDDTDVIDDDMDNENPDDDDDTDSNDDDMDNENPDDDDNDDTDSNDDDMDNENPDDDAMDSNDDDTDNENPDDDDTDNEDPEDDANDDNQDDDANNDENAAALYLCKPGYDEEFHKQDLKSIIGDNCFSVWTVFKGDFYVLTWQTRILLRLDVDDSSGTISATPMTNQPPYNYFTEYLDMPRFGNCLIQSSSSEDDNKDEVELLYVHMLFHGREFEDVYKIIVFRFDFVKKVWEEMKSIGETAIFLGPCFGGTTCCTRGTNIKKDSIYFIKGRYLCIFNLETQSISVSLPCPHISKTRPPSYWLTLMDA